MAVPSLRFVCFVVDPIRTQEVGISQGATLKLAYKQALVSRLRIRSSGLGPGAQVSPEGRELRFGGVEPGSKALLISKDGNHRDIRDIRARQHCHFVPYLLVSGCAFRLAIGVSNSKSPGCRGRSHPWPRGLLKP